MPPIPPGAGAVARAVVGVVPAVLLIVGAVLIAIVAFFIPSARQYAKEQVVNLTTLAGVLVGVEKRR